MRDSRTELKASPGDRLIVHGHRQGQPERDGEVIEVVGRDGAPPYVVRWEDGRESTLYPSSDVLVQHFEHPKRRASRAAARKADREASAERAVPKP